MTMVALEDYAGREQAYVKHIFLERYLEALFFKTAAVYDHIVYVDGFAGPWQSVGEQFEDTSFGIALNALRNVRETMQQKNHRTVKVTALLVEKDRRAYARLETVKQAYPHITIKTYKGDFRALVPQLVEGIPQEAFAFLLIDPKGWRIVLEQLRPLLARQSTEVVFNFMFEFINRAASMSENITAGLDELMPHSNWRQRLHEAEESFGRYGLTGDDRKDVLVGAFRESVRQVGSYPYVSEVTVLRPLRDRALYCLIHATRNEKGIEVFRECQVAVMNAQAATRAAGKVKHQVQQSNQAEMFDSMLDMAPDQTERRLEDEKVKAAKLVRKLLPHSPDHMQYRRLWASVLAECIVKRTDVNAICGAMKKAGELASPDWEPGKRVPQDQYRMQLVAREPSQ
jgi:three-Cys-motif partner protein